LSQMSYIYMYVCMYVYIYIYIYGGFSMCTVSEKFLNSTVFFSNITAELHAPAAPADCVMVLTKMAIHTL
jgi:hypothetical protein